MNGQPGTNGQRGTGSDKAAAAGRRRILPAFPAVGAPVPGRDLALDVARSWSLLVVVFGHFVMQITYWSDEGIPTSSNTLSSGDRWPYATWLLQVMPLFFIAGGAVNRGSWERFTGTWSRWMWQRTSRLMRPTVVFLAAMAVLFTIVSALVPQAVTGPLVSGVTGPLWFLAVYIPVTALTPLTLRWHRRNRWAAVASMLAVVVLVDAVRLNVTEAAGAVNLLVAWMLVHQLGYWYADGVGRKAVAWLLPAALATNVALTQVWDLYPTSLVGLPTEEFSNMAPPDIVLVLHAVVLFSAFVLVAPRLRTWFARPRALTATTRAGIVAMTLYLWHMAVLVAWLAACHALGWDLPVRLEAGLVVPDGLAYWLWLIPSTCGYVALLWPLVRALWPVEYMRLPLLDSRRGREHDGPWRPAAGVVAVSLGLLVVSGAGLSGFPLAMSVAFGVPVNAALGMAAVGAGVWALRQPGRRASKPAADGAKADG